MTSGRINYEKELNSEQWDVVREGDGPVLVLAGAGSGKTRTITYRVAYLLEQGVLPQEILLLTFTNKAAREMLSRVSSLLGSEPVGLWGGTFHSVASRLLRLYATEIGYTPNFTILDQDDTNTLMKVCLKELKVDTTARRFPSPAKLCGMISYARNASESVRSVVEKRYANFSELIPIIERLAEAYDTHKRQADAMDFDDLLILLRRLLIDRPVICDRLAQQFRYVLVDEYQDTNTIQAELVRLLSHVHRNVLVVGDDAQSIYSFRAADINNILRFPEVFPGARVFRLVTNYRSSPQILQVANESIRHNAAQFEKTLVAVSGDLSKPTLAPVASPSQEADFIATRVLELMNQGVMLREIAVLFRAAFHSQVLEFELVKRDIPYEFRGGLKFFERAHVKDVISYLRIRANVKDETAWLRVLGLQQGIGLVTAQKIVEQVRQSNTLSEVVAASYSFPKRAEQSWQLLSKTLRDLTKEEQPGDLIRAVVAGEYRDYVEAEYPDFMDRLEDLEQFALYADHTANLTEFLNSVSLTDEYGSVWTQGGGQEDRIVLSTIHQAKGLEWDTVFVMHLVEGKFPNPRALEEDGGMEEERRLFYVATTRARKQLVFTYPLVVGQDTMLLQSPSQFLQEISEDLLDEIRPKGVHQRTTVFQEDPVIVYDELGERTNFLRNIDEL